MELLFNNIDLILIAAVIVIAAIVFARRGQIELLRELIVGIAGSVEADELYAKLPTVTRMLVSGKTVGKLVSESKRPNDTEVI